MAYTPQSFVKGQVLKADHLNHMEEGISAIDKELTELKSTVPGTEAVSPTISTEEIDGGTRVTVTDVNGQRSFDVMDGVDGNDGKSAYETAKDAGYTGTEAEFAERLMEGVDDIHIGGRNLIAGTDGATIFSGAAAAEGSSKDVWKGTTISPPTGTEYIVSFDAKADIAMDISCYFYSPNTTLTSESSTGQKRTNVVDGSSTVSVTTEWKRYWVKWTQTPADAVKQVYIGRNYSTSLLYIRAVKLEEGNIPSAWTPAPEDINTQINKKANDFSIELYNGTSGNPKPVKFATIDYSSCTSEAGVSIKIGMVSGHGNGTSYAFLQDAIIKVNYNGGVEVDNFKYYGAETAYDGAKQFGDIFWVVDATNKIVDFYCLMGQYSRLNMTPFKRLTYSSGGTIVQYTSCSVYSSGTIVWANNSDIALMSDVNTKAPAYSYSQEDLTAGTSALETGKLHFVYE